MDEPQVDRYTVTFPLGKVYEEVHVQSWYQGEALKRKDPDTVIVQSSEDDTTQMQTVCESALNDVALRLAKRLRDVGLSRKSVGISCIKKQKIISLQHGTGLFENVGTSRVAKRDI